MRQQEQNRLRGSRPLRGGGTPFGQKSKPVPEVPGPVCYSSAAGRVHVPKGPRAAQAVLLSLIVATPFGATAETAHRVSVAEAAAAIYAAYPQLADSVVELPEPVFSRADTPVLAVGALERWGAGSAATEHVRLRCKAEGACLPFYATVRLGPAVLADLKTPTQAQAPETAAAIRADRPAPPVPLVRSGDPVLLLIDSGGLHLRIHATCLSNAEAGATVRVAGPAHRVVYQAEVVDRDTVRGSL